MQAVILCGGKGTRLRPLTYKIPKPMAPVKDKPFLLYQVEFLKKQGIKNFVFCTGYKWRHIFDYFGDGSKFGINISYSNEKKQLGTGGALRLALPLLEEDFLAVYGDSFIDIDYSDFYKKAKSTKKDMVILAYSNKLKTGVKNNLLLGKKGEVLDYDKKNPNPKMSHVDAGVLYIRKKILEKIPKNKAVSLEENIFKKLINLSELSSVATKKRFYDIGTFERLSVFKEIAK